MRTILLKRVLPFVFGALTLACGDDAKVDPDFATSSQPQSLEDALFYVSSDSNGGHALTLDVATDKPKVIKHDLPAGPVQTFALPGSGGRQLVVFTGGVAAVKKGDKRIAAEVANVLLFDRTGELLRQPLSGRYSSLNISDDGKFAVAFGSSGNLVLQNAVEVINLELARSQAAAGQALTAATLMDLSFDGRAPSSFVFGPSTGFARRLAIAPLANSLQVIELDHPENGETSIKLSESASLQPVKLVFATDQFFVQNQSSTQILSFQVLDQAVATQPSGPQPTFQLAPSILTTTANVEDLETVGSGDTLRLLALAGDLQVLDPRIGGTASVPGVGSFSQIFKFNGASPVDSNVSPRAALYGPNVAQLGFVDLANEKDWSTRNVETVELGDPLLQLIPIAGTDLALATHTTNRVSLIDLEQRTVKRVLLDSSSISTLLDQVTGTPPTATILKLWVAGSDDSLGNIDLTSLKATEVPLSFSYASSGSAGGDAPTSTSPLSLQNQQNLLIVPGPVATAPHRRIAVVQSSSVGRVTLLDADNPVPDSALDVVGFFIAGLFD